MNKQDEKKAKKIAKDWIRPHLMEAIFDCSDSSYEAKEYEHRFSERVNDEITIQKYVATNLEKEYLEEIGEVLKEGGEEEYDLNQTAMELLIYPKEKVVKINYDE